MSPRSSILHCNGTNVRVCQARQRVLHTFFNFLWDTTPTLSKLIAKRLFFTPANYKITPLENHYLDPLYAAQTDFQGGYSGDLRLSFPHYL